MNKMSFKGVIFDLDGVITKTAAVHAKSWQAMFNQFLQKYSTQNQIEFKPFTHEHDYLPFVDGKPRYEGVQSFLESRGIHLPFGEESDAADQETICGLGNKKNEMFTKILAEEGAEVYPATKALIDQLQELKIKMAVASSSKNCQLILQKTNLEDYFLARVDGSNSPDWNLKGKPEPDIFLKAAELIQLKPKECIVVEDASSGVAAGKKGAFGLVLGLARENNQQQLLENGADQVVTDFADTNLEEVNQWFQQNNH